ncbi:Sensor protein QseC [Hartmannibacter diazotrophicus]|uniref:histidine kinase n=1 Tax=Hartmannibacter diazotrophicus TaxID=1482074 RepID=A0A2C9D4K0_9HYPH|nr:sensor histidine kinase [Hartmannibacter diazotrophicus]SON55109.1 Sensor protein QseC [Hartmannibacter diazotrophicus]
MNRTFSITSRLAVATAFVLSLGGIGIAVAAYAYGQQAANAAYDRMLAGAAFEISRAMAVNDGRLEVDLPISAFELLSLAPDDRIVYRVIGADGRTVTGQDWAPRPKDHTEEMTFFSTDHGGERFRLASLDRPFSERSYRGDVTVVVGHTTRARDALTWDITAKALTIGLVAGLIVTGIAIFAVRSALRPLTVIETALIERDPMDLSALNVSTPREVRTIIEAINRFMSRLAQRVATMQNLIGDASHQLKTPIAALRLQAELALQEDNPERMKTALRKIHGRAVNLSRLAEQMLSQAMIMHRADTAPQVVVDLREVAITVTEDADHAAASGGATPLRLDLPEEPVPVRGDGPSLVEATKNLVNNAYRYGRPPYVLAVRADGVKGLADIVVIDHGDGFEEAFGEGARARFASHAGAHPDSAGLGLAIVEAVANAHRGRLDFVRRGDGAFEARLECPLAAEEAA